MNVICFGDSNTYGYDPRGYFGGRYEADSRWVDIVAAENWLDGPQHGAERPGDPHVGPSPSCRHGSADRHAGDQRPAPGQEVLEQAAGRLGRLLSGISLERSKLLLIAPPPVSPGRVGARPTAHRRLPRL